jgi:uncharacterized protein YjiS (DUF1127 family)
LNSEASTYFFNGEANARRLPLAGAVSSSAVSSSAVFSQFHRVYVIIADWRARADEHRSLARLDDRLLADIGLSREQQAAECARFFWAVMMADDCATTRKRIGYPRNL